MFAHNSVVLRKYNHPENNFMLTGFEPTPKHNIIYTGTVYKLNVYMIPGCPLILTKYFYIVLEICFKTGRYTTVITRYPRQHTHVNVSIY